MRILSIETTEQFGTVAAASGDKLLAELQLDADRRSTRSLAPALKSLFEKIGWRPADVELVAVTIGPGSFTGLRVGLTTAKVFAYAVGAQILGVDTLETIAAAAPPEVGALWTAMDAQRGDVIARPFRRAPGGFFEPQGPAELLAAEAWLAALPRGSVVSGPVLTKLANRLPAGVSTLDQSYWRPRAADVARLAMNHYAGGRRDDLWTLLPHYSRPSAAEEKWARK
jgi:tRNA threonylcarbamoyladenosine biosynthesis protein TsaB